MTLRSQFCNGESKGKEQETMLFLILEDNGEEKLRVPIYLSAEAKELMPNLKTSLHSLPDLLKMIYNSGLNKEPIEFKVEDIQI